MWTIRDIPSQSGKLAVVTGATGGLGYETALALAGAGAEVILAGRNPTKGASALAQIKAAHPRAARRFEALDLASLASVADFSARLASADRSIDILVNNAGVMALPTRETTADGFEKQFGTNYLGHFALTARLLPLLEKARARVINLASLAHSQGRIDFGDLQGERGYTPWRAYSQSKLAMLMFALELQRRSDAAGWALTSLAAHPGFAHTDLIANGPATGGLMAPMFHFAQPFVRLLGQSAAAGALPTLFAATAPSARGGAYFGPQGIAELRGPAGPARLSLRAKDTVVARRLWDESERLTGVRFPRPGVMAA